MGEQQNWDLEAEGISGLQVDDQFYLGALLDWEVSRLGAVENLSGVGPCRLSYVQGEISAITHQATILGKLPDGINSWHRITGC